MVQQTSVYTKFCVYMCVCHCSTRGYIHGSGIAEFNKMTIKITIIAKLPSKII